jgi:hypothetical protein
MPGTHYPNEEIMNNCDEFCWTHGCNQGKDCPVRVAKYKPTMYAADPLPPASWRARVNSLAYWMFLGVMGLFWLAFIALLVHLGVD